MYRVLKENFLKTVISCAAVFLTLAIFCGCRGGGESAPPFTIQFEGILFSQTPRGITPPLAPAPAGYSYLAGVRVKLAGSESTTGATGKFALSNASFPVEGTYLLEIKGGNNYFTCPVTIVKGKSHIIKLVRLLDGNSILTDATYWKENSVIKIAVSVAVGSGELTTCASLARTLSENIDLDTLLLEIRSLISQAETNARAARPDLITVDIPSDMENLFSGTLVTAGRVLLGITLTPSSITLVPSEQQQLIATASYSDESTAEITAQLAWSSSDPSVATVSNTGLVTGVAPGEASVTGNSISGKSCEARVTVVESLISLLEITVVPSQVDIAPSDTRQLVATGYYSDGSTAEITAQLAWSSSDPSVATVSNTGLVTGVAPGEAVITGTFISGKSCEVRVSVIENSISLLDVVVIPARASIMSENSRQLTATGYYSDGSTAEITAQLAWSSSDPSVATVSNTGLVTAVSAGTAVITGTSLSGKSGTCTVTVFESLTGLAVSNITSTQAVITWITPRAETGTVHYGTTSSLGSTLSESTATGNHSITISGLSPLTVYYFKVVSGELTDDNAGSLYTFKTATAGFGTSYILAGQVKNSDSTPASGAIVLVKIGTSEGSSYLSDITDSSGFFDVNLSNLKTESGFVYQYRPGDTVTLEIYKSGSRPVKVTGLTISGTSPQDLGTFTLQ